MPVGKGSYASSPPNPDKKVQEMATRPMYVDPSQLGKPIPTNHWWTYLINNATTQEKKPARVWPYPLAAETNPNGLTVLFPNQWEEKKADMDPGTGPLVTGVTFSPQDATVFSWGDWSVGIRYKQDDAHLMDITLARGMPFAWFEYKGVQPSITMPPGAVLQDAKGQPLSLPAATNRIVVSVDNRLFAIFAPDGSTFSGNAGSLQVNGAAFLVVGALPSLDQLDFLTTYAYAIPRNTQFDFTYDPAKGRVDTSWTVETAALQGTNKDVIQGWLPHHYRTTIQDLKFTPLEYTTVRGRMRCSTGQHFAIAWPFNGFPPELPAPAEIAGQPNPFSKDRMKQYIDGYVLAHTNGKNGGPLTGKERYGADTYWGGKSLTQYGLYGNMAVELGYPDDSKFLLGTLDDAMADWFTYTPGEKVNYFARYDRWKAMVGFKPSYGSDGFVDNHFHYGYFTLASAYLGMHNPQFLQDYGPMAKLVAKQYANWDRNDKDFPYFRTFDPWAGHSYASGSGSPNGGNQESSSEAMQSWSGLFMLGVMLQDKDMTAAGAMGWSVEETAVEEYWFDYYGWKEGPKSANFPSCYQHAISANAYDAGYAYGTFFGGQPHYVYGIQWLPLQTGLYYLGRDPKFSQHELDSMIQDEQAKSPGFSISNMKGDKGDWADVTLGFLQFSNPDSVAAQMDTLWDAKNTAATSMNTAGLSYYFAHANRQLGPVAWDYHTDLPASLVFQKPGANLTVVAWNQAEADVVCHVYHGDQVVGQVTIPSRKLTSVSVPAK